MKLLVIIPMYNAEKFINECINSLTFQNINMRIIIVDDSSTDSSYRIALKNPSVEVLHNAVNMGTYLSINRALYYASGDSTWTHYTIHGADDISLPGRFKNQLSMFHNDSLNAVGCRFVRVDWNTKKQFKTNPKTNESVLVFKREVFNKLGYYNSNRFGSDTEYKLRFNLAFGQNAIASTPQILIHSYLHSNNLTKSVPINGTDRREFVAKFTATHETMKMENNFYLNNKSI
jgi:glycosyltransferase involved in cell wall biosynthesis